MKWQKLKKALNLFYHLLKENEMNKEQIDKLAWIYSQSTHDAFIVAKICDEVLDKSGHLLGRVRVVARKMINH